MCVALQRQVPRPGVLRAADLVVAPGPPAVLQFQVRELAARGVCEQVAVDVGEPQLRAGVRTLLADG